MVAVTMLAISAGVFGSIVSGTKTHAESGTYTMSLSKGIASTVETGVSKSKDKSPAQIISNKAVGSQDTVYAYAVNSKGTVVSKTYASFRNTTGTATRDVAYTSNSGVKGKKYRLGAKLDKSSKSNPLKVSLTFIP